MQGYYRTCGHPILAGRTTCGRCIGKPVKGAKEETVFDILRRLNLKTISSLIFLSGLCIYLWINEPKVMPEITQPSMIHISDDARLIALQSMASAFSKKLHLGPISLGISDAKVKDCNCFAFYQSDCHCILVIKEYLNTNPSFDVVVNIIEHEIIHHWVWEHGLYSDFAQGHNEAFIRKAIEMGVNLDSTLSKYPETRPIYDSLIEIKKKGWLRPADYSDRER